MGTALWIGVEYENISHNGAGHEHFIRLAKLLSVPLVCLLFTWFHVWLALQMMFYPIDSRSFKLMGISCEVPLNQTTATSKAPMIFLGSPCLGSRIRFHKVMNNSGDKMETSISCSFRIKAIPNFIG